MKRFELKSVKYFAEGSQETNCYVADFFVDGKKFCAVQNEGCGGSDMQIPYAPFTHQDVLDLNNWCKENLPKKTWSYDPPQKDLTISTDIELICGDLLMDNLLRKDFKRSMKSNILFLEINDDTNESELFISGYRGVRKIETRHIERFKANHPNAILLRDMNEEEAFDIFKQAS